MKKLTLVIASCLILSVAVWAQGGAGGAGGSGSAPSGAAGTSQQSGTQGSMSGQSTASDQPTASHHEHKKTVEGCIVQQGSEFFLATHNNSKFFRLNAGGTDLSAHVGHKVKVHGTEQKVSVGAGAAESTPATTATPSTSSSSQTASTSNPSSSQPGSLPQSSTGAGASGNAGAAGAGVGGGAAAGTSSSSMGSSSNITVDPSKIDKEEITVSSVDMVSDSCGGSSDKNAPKDTNKPKTPY